jgi:Cu2+-exporting ATPase
MIQNLWWAAGYNIVAFPLAAAVLMSVSTIVVAINAQLLRKTAF